MDRREFCLNAFLATAALSAPRICGASGDIDGHIILVELTGANDGLNTVVPFKNDRYYSLRPE
ncbi:MAG: twin-arginine translocation pathway signal, partial [Gammaproteobacteria bacterium]|nr:twin-arginine translocation pathway signal [Gammaproteobacteria bacterium]